MSDHGRSGVPAAGRLGGRTGRRAGDSRSREAILEAARRRFADRGYDGATIRAIAMDAGVDPALVHHFYGTKRDLFVAAMQLPFDPLDVVAAGTHGDPRRAGERLARKLLDVWGTEDGRAMMQSLLRSALTDEHVLRMLRQFVLDTVLLPIARAVSPDRRRLRAGLLASQVIGLAFVRYVARVEPLASASRDAVVAAIAPTLQRYLTRDLGPAPRRHRDDG